MHIQTCHSIKTLPLTWNIPKTINHRPHRHLLPPPKSTITTTPPSLKISKTHSMPPEKLEIFKSLENWASESVLPLLKPVEQCWQPQNFLPDPSLPFDEFTDQVKVLRDRTKDLPDEYFVVLVGDMVTEDALPTYQSMINGLDGVGDEVGSSPSPWAVWTRAWTAEENRHGDLLRTYLYLSGRVDMEMIEKTVQYLIGAGMVKFLKNFISENMKQKIVMRVSMRCQKCRTKALKVVAGANGVNFVGLEGDEKDKIVVIGDGVDAVKLTNCLRKKVGQTEIVSLGEVKAS